jgi:hypothetical protein
VSCARLILPMLLISGCVRHVDVRHEARGVIRLDASKSNGPSLHIQIRSTPYIVWLPAGKTHYAASDFLKVEYRGKDVSKDELRGYIDYNDQTRRVTIRLDRLSGGSWQPLPQNVSGTARVVD